MKLYIDLDTHQFTNSRGVPQRTPLELSAGTSPLFQVYFLRNGAVVVPDLNNLTVSVGRLDSAPVASETSYTVAASGAHNLLLDLTQPTLLNALTAGSWDTMLSDGVSRTYLIAGAEAAPSLVRAKGFRVKVTTPLPAEFYIPSGLFAVDAVARTLTLDSSVLPDEDAQMVVEALVPKAAFMLRVSGEEDSLASFVAALPVDILAPYEEIALSPLAQFDPQYVASLPDYTSLTGGTATDLDSLVTVDVDVGLTVFVSVSVGGSIRGVHFRLVAGTDAENTDPDAGPLVVRPDDYNGATNAKVWVEI